MNTPDDLRSALASLQEPPVPDALWPRLRAGRQRQARRRRAMAVLLPGGLVAALFVALVQPGTAPAPVLPAVPGSAQAVAVDDRDARVEAIDRALQAAYDRGASDTEVAPMWEARHALLAGTANARGHAGDINDI